MRDAYGVEEQAPKRTRSSASGERRAIAGYWNQWRFGAELILDALRPGRSHPSHFSVEEAIAVAARVKARRLVLTHMSHEMDYETLTPALPPGVELGYDGMSIEF